MKKTINNTKELARVLGLNAIANNINNKSTADEIFGYICIMANYMMAHNSCTDEMKKRICNGLKMLTLTLNIEANKNYKLAA